MRLRLLLSIIAAGLILAACSHDEEPTTDTAAWHTITITTEDATRTELRETENRVAWSGEDRIVVFENDKHVESTDASIDREGHATFGVTFPTSSTPPYDYNGLYPVESLFYAHWNTDITSLKLSLSATQSPTTTSFDPSCDLLIAKQIETSEQPTSLMMRFKRIVAMNKLTLKGLPADGTISRVTFIIPDRTIAGLVAVNLPTGKVEEYGAVGVAHNEITLNYPTPIATNTPIYFNSFPVQLTEGDSFSVRVVCNGATYTRQVTIPAQRELRLEAGALNTLAVDMSHVLPIIPESYTPGTLYNRNGKRGVVFAIKDFPIYNSDYTAIVGYDSYCYIMSLKEEDVQWSTRYEWCNCISQRGDYNTYDPFDYYGMNINDYPAFKWCMAQGEGWFLPSSTELQWMWEAITDGARDFDSPRVAEYNKLLTDNGGEPFVETYYWSSNETSESLVEVIAFMDDSVVCLDPKKDEIFTARAVYRFKIQ